MDGRNWMQQHTPTMSAGTDHNEEMLAEVDEPPDERSAKLLFSQPISSWFDKASSSMFQRRESLLTRQLHSETEHTDDDSARAPTRALSTQSTWSTTSTADLTSDDGRSVPSPAISPPLPPTIFTSVIPSINKSLAPEPKIVGQDDAGVVKPVATPAEKAVEAGLGRKRCISFACGGKKSPTSAPAPVPVAEPPAVSSPPKRKCALKFFCPTRTTATSNPADDVLVRTKRAVSPPPVERKPSIAMVGVVKAHRGSDSTVTHSSPKSVKRAPSIVTDAPTPTTESTPRRFSNDESDDGTEAVRFHEFASSDGEPEDWVQEATCHRSRLTVGDTLKKETYLRKACEEVEEEAVEEEELEDDEDDVNQDEDDLADELDIDQEDSDEGFRTDDEEGFADSDSDAEDSDEGWWRAGALSTAATSVDHMEKLLSHTKIENTTLASSVGSLSSIAERPRSFQPKHTRKTRAPAMIIGNRPEPVDLPDSTDFVCGTLDEDRPLEQAFINNMREREAAKHKARPQDIDPSFPTSDPDTDEEDDEDLVEPEESGTENLLHGELDQLDGDLTARRRDSPPVRTVHRSPPPPRRGSPAPLKRMATRSPPPPKRNVARSPPMRKLFGHSPVRANSPAPTNRTSSPPNTRRASPINSPTPMPFRYDGLATRTQLTHTASLPRTGGFMLSKLCKLREEDGEGSDNLGGATNELHKRGAIDIVKGLEKKRQRRKEKLHQKLCAKAAAKGEKAYKVKPGKGAERMREVGLELQRYHGKGEHILSM